MREPRPARLALVAVLVAVASACTGQIHSVGPGTGSATGAGAATNPGTTGAAGDPGTATGAGNVGGTLPPVPADLVFKPGPSGLRRLTVAQYENSVRDIFGDGATVTTDLEPDTDLSGFVSIGAATVGLSPRATEQFETASLEVAKKGLADATRRMALGGCAPAGVTDDACTRKFIQNIGRRAWRRPLVDEEIGRYAAVAKNAQTVLNNFVGGLEYGVAGLLQSPNFLYRVEFGSPDAQDATRVVFNDYELATRLAYFLWNTTPDETLLAAADGRQLGAPAALTTQAQRLLASPRTAAAMQTFFSEFYHLATLDGLPQLPAKFPLVTPTLGPAMRAETLRFLEDVAFTRDADFREIFDSRATFVNGELAKLYGLSGITGAAFVATTLPDSGLRAGLLGKASFLSVSSGATRGSPTKRGKFIREMILCQGIPAAPPGVEPLPENGTGTAKQKLEVHRSVASCAACHKLMDPIGLAFENFDAIGALRTMDGGQVIDASGDLDGVAFASPRELAALLKAKPETSACVARNMFRHAMGHLEGDGEEGAITQVAKTFADGGYKFRALLAGVVASPAFVYAAKPTP